MPVKAGGPSAESAEQGSTVQYAAEGAEKLYAVSQDLPEPLAPERRRAWAPQRRLLLNRMKRNETKVQAADWRRHFDPTDARHPMCRRPPQQNF